MKTSKAPMPYNQDRVCLIYVRMAVKGQGIHMANTRLESLLGCPVLQLATCSTPVL